MRSAFTFAFLVLLLTACRHVEPERRSTEAEIRRYIVGEWTATDQSEGFWFPTLIIEGDGTLIGVLGDGKKELIGTWEMSHCMLRVTPTASRAAAAGASGSHLNHRDYFPVIYAGAHELVLTPGISVAGRWKFTR